MTYTRHRTLYITAICMIFWVNSGNSEGQIQKLGGTANKHEICTERERVCVCVCVCAGWGGGGRFEVITPWPQPNPTDSPLTTPHAHDFLDSEGQ